MKFKLKQKEPTLQEILRTRASVRRQIITRKSVQEGRPDRVADLLEQAADRIDELEKCIGEMDDIVVRLEAKFNNENLN